VVVISRDGNKLRAVELVKQSDVFEVLWTRSEEASQVDIGTFAAECNLSEGGTEEAGTPGDKIVAVGFDSSGVIFYRINVPAVKEKELAAIVKLQAEARLPLPSGQMEMSWRTDRIQDEQPVAVTIAAARREHLQEFVDDVRSFEPVRILLDCEGIVKVWRELFSGDSAPAVIVSIRSRDTQVCLAEGGKLINALSLDMGMEDFSAVQGSVEQMEIADRFVQDMRSVLELFGCAEPGEVPIFVLSDGGDAVEEITSYLESGGLNALAAVPQMQRLRSQTELGAGDIYEYRVPIGLAMMAFEAKTDELNIFERLYRTDKEKQKRHWFHSPKITGTITAVMLALLLVVCYAADVASVNRLSGLEAKTDFNLLMQRRKLIKTIALQRPDMLGLLKDINSTEHNGIVLSSVHFKKGQPVTIKGQAKGDEQLFKFQKSLESMKGIKRVLIENQTTKDKKREFTITFHCGRFTEKSSRLKI